MDLPDPAALRMEFNRRLAIAIEAARTIAAATGEDEPSLDAIQAIKQRILAELGLDAPP